MAYRIAALVAVLVSPVAGQPLDSDPTLTFLGGATLHYPKDELTEPSGLSIGADGVFWVISDDTSAVYAIDHDGKIVERQNISPRIADPEGVVHDAAGGRLLLLSEADREIVQVDLETGRVSAVYPIAGMTGGASLRIGEHGPEGIALGRDGVVWALVEYPPVLLQLAPDLSAVSQIVALDHSTGYSSPEVEQPDASGLAYDQYRDALWILSDTGSAVFFRPFDSEALVRYDLVFTDDSGALSRVSNPEGIAVSDDGTTLVVVTDDGKSSGLFRYRID